MKRKRGFVDRRTRSKKIELRYEPKDWDYIIRPDRWFAGKINVSSTNMVISNLYGKLSADQRALFRKTCFGPYVDMKEIAFQSQLVHQVLLREVKQPNPDEMWFKIGEKCLRFSVHEFCLITGLRCTGNDDHLKYQSRQCRIKDAYFKELPNITRSDVQEVFLNLKGASDEDIVKIGILYLITSFLFTKSYQKLVDLSLMVLVDSKDMESFPWGKELFRLTLSSLKIALKKKSLNFEGRKKGSEAYRLNGFPLAFQVWIYETIPSLTDKICTKLDGRRPRMLNWRSESHVTSSKLDKNVFGMSELKVNVVEPTQAEKEEAYMVGLIDKGRRTLDDNNDDFEDPQLRALKASDTQLCTHNEGCCHSNEETMTRLVDVQSKQQQLASEQLELKLEMLSLKRFVADKFGDVNFVLNEIKRNLGIQSKSSDLQLVPYHGGVDSEKKGTSSCSHMDTEMKRKEGINEKSSENEHRINSPSAEAEMQKAAEIEKAAEAGIEKDAEAEIENVQICSQVQEKLKSPEGINEKSSENEHRINSPSAEAEIEKAAEAEIETAAEAGIEKDAEAAIEKDAEAEIENVQICSQGQEKLKTPEDPDVPTDGKQEEETPEMDDEALRVLRIELGDEWYNAAMAKIMTVVHKNKCKLISPPEQVEIKNDELSSQGQENLNNP